VKKPRKRQFHAVVLSAGSQITELQQRLKESERQREELSKQLQNADSERESAQLARLRQENQRLKLQLKEAQASPLPRLLTDQQQWFVIGAGLRHWRCCAVSSPVVQAENVGNG
jgi:seryl-tRNA synthetase